MAAGPGPRIESLSSKEEPQRLREYSQPRNFDLFELFAMIGLSTNPARIQWGRRQQLANSSFASVPATSFSVFQFALNFQESPVSLGDAAWLDYLWLGWSAGDNAKAIVVHDVSVELASFSAANLCVTLPNPQPFGQVPGSSISANAIGVSSIKNALFTFSDLVAFAKARGGVYTPGSLFVLITVNVENTAAAAHNFFVEAGAVARLLRGIEDA